jgi:hypothetical protein
LEFYEDGKMILHSNCTEMECSLQDHIYGISLQYAIIYSQYIPHQFPLDPMYIQAYYSLHLLLAIKLTHFG